ncbi:MAG: hypothetical protein ABIH63_04840 [archaeon]
MNYRGVLTYGIAGLIFLGSYTMPIIARAQTATNSVKQQFFDTVVDYARKQGLDLNKIGEQRIEIKSEVKRKDKKGNDEKVLGLFNRQTRKMEIEKSTLENIATIGVHEITHEKFYDVEESEFWFRKIPYKVQKQGDTYIATIENGLRSWTIPEELQKLTIKDEGMNSETTIYDAKGNMLVKLQMTRIESKDDLTMRAKGANYEINGLQGEWHYEKYTNKDCEDITLSYKPSEEITEFYNEVIARIYEQVFGGYYHGKNIYKITTEKDKSILGKSLAYLTSTYSLTPEQQKISENAEEAYIRLNEQGLLGLLEKILPIGGKTFKEAMNDAQDERFSKSIAIASVVLTEQDFKTLLDIYDRKGKEEVIQLLSEQIQELEKTKKIGILNEQEIIREYLKRFNLNDEEAEYVMGHTKHTNFNEILKNKEKIKHIENIKQKNLEKLMEPFRPQEKEITKGL